MKCMDSEHSAEDAYFNKKGTKTRHQKVVTAHRQYRGGNQSDLNKQIQRLGCIFNHMVDVSGGYFN